jgi:hypothetical protein
VQILLGADAQDEKVQSHPFNCITGAILDDSAPPITFNPPWDIFPPIPYFERFEPCPRDRIDTRRDAIPANPPRNHNPTALFDIIDNRGFKFQKLSTHTKGEIISELQIIHAAGFFGKGSNWGVYTVNRANAEWLFDQLSIRSLLIEQGGHNIGQFSHFHIHGGLWGRYTDFHLWYGLPRAN